VPILTELSQLLECIIRLPYSFQDDFRIVACSSSVRKNHFSIWLKQAGLIVVIGGSNKDEVTGCTSHTPSYCFTAFTLAYTPVVPRVSIHRRMSTLQTLDGRTQSLRRKKWG
jgi:hypothetical protein